MPYYTIEHGGKGDIGFIEDCPLGTDGKSLIERGAPPYAIELQINRELPDLLRTMGACYMFSERAMACLSKLRMHDSISFFSVTVSTPNPCRYYIATGPKLKILDRDRSDFRWLVPNKLICDVSRWVFDSNAVPVADLFRADDMSWIVSQAFRDLWFERGLSGAEFVKVSD